jgi:cobalamin biosynthesis protein CobT
MESAPKPIFELPNKDKKVERPFRSAERGFSSDTAILAGFSPVERTEILHKQKLLSSLAYFIGKDFSIPVELNKSGEGWHWDFANNIIRIDPKDLLEKPLDYLRFVISHEGGHRRISRTEFIPEEVWRQPGFSFMMNAIEDPRDNNFVEENYPRFRQQMELAYDTQFEEQRQAAESAKEKVGFTPRFIEAGFGYIRQWYSEKIGKEVPAPPDIPEEVTEVVAKTVDAARESWWVYPSREEADRSEELIRRYAEASYTINKEKVWPEFKKLVDLDMEDQKAQEMLQDMKNKQRDNQEGGEEGSRAGDKGQSISQELKDNLTPQEKQELEDVINRALEKEKEQRDAEKGQAEKGEQEGKEKPSTEPDEEGEETGTPSDEPFESPQKPVDLSSLSEGLVQKIKEYIESLPKEARQELQEKAETALKELEEELNEELEGKLSLNPERKSKRAKPVEPKQEKEEESEAEEQPRSYDEESLRRFREQTERILEGSDNVYEEQRKEVLHIIDKLETDLREIFTERRSKKWESGFKFGKRISLKHRIQEKAKGVLAVQSKAWQKRELPTEKDYAITLLNDLSGSMQGEKIQEDFKAKIVLAEVLNRLSIRTEILGFNDRIYEYKPFHESMSKEVREHMGTMLREVHDTSDTGRAQWNDDGWALEQASQRLAKEKAGEKFLIVLSDGQPAESPMHPRSKYELGKIVRKVMEDTDQKLVGVGIGPGTSHVDTFYPHSIADVTVEDMAEQLADLIREVIVNYDKF